MNAIHAIVNRRFASESAKKIIHPAADRNKEPILNVLKKIICPGANQVFLEISSGTGQHMAHFAPNFPQVTFYPSEYDQESLDSISTYVSGFTNVHEPLLIDITTNYTTWGDGIFKKSSIDYIYNSNMVHISPFETSVGLFKNAGELLKPNGTLITYGPYAVDGKITPESNVQFDKTLKSRDPRWGIRDIRDLEKLAAENGIKLVEMFDMPANNKTLIWKKE